MTSSVEMSCDDCLRSLLILKHIVCSSWGQAAKCHMDKILILQKRIVRLMKFANFNSHALSYFIPSKILPINMLYFKLCSLLMLGASNNSIPSNLSDFFTPAYQIHSYYTRSVFGTISLIIGYLNLTAPAHSSC